MLVSQSLRLQVFFAPRVLENFGVLRFKIEKVRPWWLGCRNIACEITLLPENLKRQGLVHTSDI